MTLSIAVIDYGAGNLRSIRRALEAAGADVAITDRGDDVRRADAIVFPGVGAAGAAMRRLREQSLVVAINDVVRDGRPFLGVCLGMQLLFEYQEEGHTEGLGLLRGAVRSLPPGLKSPQIGWNQVHWVRDATGYAAGAGDDFYFVHSYVVAPTDPDDVVAVTQYGGVFPSIVRHGNVWGTQFHPEKSGAAGLRLVAGWVAEAQRAAASRLERVPA